MRKRCSGVPEVGAPSHLPVLVRDKFFYEIIVVLLAMFSFVADFLNLLLENT